MTIIMRKTLSLMLSAALTLGSVASSYAAPLKKATDGTKKTITTAKAEKGAKNRIVTKTFNNRSKTAGFNKVQSTVTATNKRALRSATAGSHAVASDVNLRGCMIFNGAWSESAEYGIYNVPTTPEGTFSLVGPTEAGYYSGYDDGNGLFYGLNYADIFGFIQIYAVDIIDTETWEVLETIETDYTMMALDIALDPTTGEVYGCYYDDEGTGYVWGKGDYASATREAIAPLQTAIVGVGCDKNGQYWGIDENSTLVKIDKLTGEVEEIASTDIPYQYFVGGCVNDQNNTFLMTYNTDTEAGIAEVDLTTGETTYLSDFNGTDAEITALYIAKPAADAKAPAAPTLNVTCENGSMDVTVKLTMPTTLFDGTPASGQTFSYSVLAGSTEVLSGSATAGSEVTETITMTESGIIQFTATASNDTGASPRAKASCYVGKGTPSAPANVKLAWNAGTATLTWDAVTESSDGGYLDPAAVTYTVLDAAGQIVSDSQASTTYTASVPEPEGFIMIGYSVKANYDGKASEATASNKVGLGAYDAPVTFDMTDNNVFGQHGIVDVNGDRSTWEFYDGHASYKWSSANDADDWLISPGIRLTAGKTYEFSTTIAAGSERYQERIEIFAGQGANPDAMTIELVPATELTSPTPVELRTTITPTTTGIYNIGFHAISDADQLRINITSYEIGAAMVGTAPGKVEQVEITPDINGELKAAISFKTPSVTVDGSDLTGNVTVSVYRGEEFVKNVTGAKGTTLSLEDTSIPEKGTYTYSFVTSNTSGNGLTAKASAFIGPRTPAAITGATATETTPGTIVLNWDAVTTDVNEVEILSEYISYNVYYVEATSYGLSIGDKVNTTPITGTTYTVTTDPQENQGFYYLALEVLNRDVAGAPIAVSTIVGTPYEMPVQYTNNDNLAEFFLMYGGDGDLMWGSSSLGVNAQDGDDAYFAIKHAGMSAATFLGTGKINISGEKPVLTFYEYSVAADDTNETVVSVIVDNVETELLSYANSDNNAEAWTKVNVPLDDYVGKTVQLKITAVCNAYVYSLYDNIKIFNMPDYDLSIVSISAPANVEANKEFDVTVNVANEGAQDTDSYSVNLYKNGEIVDTKTVRYGLAANESEAVTFKQTLTLADETAEYKAAVVYEADQDLTNNESTIVTVTRKHNTMPVVTGLTGEQTEAGNSLTWDPIVIGEPEPRELTEDFESGEPFADEFEGWTFIDVDGGANGGFQNLDIPNHPLESAYSFFVFDNTDFSDNFTAHSGTKFLATMFHYDDSQIDDWAISPLLPGTAQTVSFYAMSFSSEYRETIEVWYSTLDSTDPKDFVKLDEFKKLPNTWTEYSVDLPEGAQHFAIRSCAAGSFMLMLDDVTYTKIYGFNGTLQGYNVYRDGVKVNEALLTETSYLDTIADDEAHTYTVTAVYDLGESEFSEPVTIESSGVEMISAAAMKVSVEGKTIVVTGAAGKTVTINAVDGKTIYNAQGDARVTVDSAVYLVTVDRRTVKVIVK